MNILIKKIRITLHNLGWHKWIYKSGRMGLGFKIMNLEECEICKKQRWIYNNPYDSPEY